MDPISTEYKFQLPVGYQSDDGTLHREGVMRLATAGDEIFSMRDHRVQANPAYHSIVVLARVVVKLGALEMITPGVIEGLYMADYSHLLRLYEEINAIDNEPKEQTGSSHLQDSPLGNVETLPFQTSFMKR